MSFRRRIVVLVAAAVAVAIVAASALVYVVMRSELTSGLDERLRGQSAKVTFVSRRALPASVAVSRPASGGVKVRVDERRTVLGTTEGPVDGQAGIVVPGPLGGSAAVAQLVTGDGDVLHSLGAGPALPLTERARAVAAGRADAFYSDARIDGVDVRMLTVAGPDGSVLTVAEPRGDVDSALHRLLAILVGVSGAGVAAAAGLGVLVSRRALTPVVALTDATEHVAATQDLSRRIDTGRSNDELARLAGSFNTMLAALDGARAAQRQLVADASHELRTPLTAVRTSIEALAGAPDLPAGERARVLAATQVQLEDLSLLIGDLVDLARPAAPAEELEEVRLDLLVEEQVQRARRHAPSTEFRLDAARQRRAGGAGAAAPRRRQPARQRRQARRRRWSRWRSATAASACATADRASPRRTCRTSSTASTAPAERAACPAPASGWRSCGRWRRRTAAACAAETAAGGGAQLVLSLPS